MAAMVKEKVRFGPFEVDLHTGELSKNGTPIHLQPQPLQVLAILLERPGELVTREEFRKRLWDDDTFVDFEHSLNTDIKKLRHALGDEAETPRYIETLAKRGYRFIGKVEISGSSTRPPIVQTETTHFYRSLIVPEPLTSPPPQLRRRVVRILLGLLAISALGVGFLIANRVLFRPTPRIVNTRRVTSTGIQKLGGYPCYLGMDGTRVYFNEHRTRDRWTLAQASTSGGEIVDIPTPDLPVPCIQGISPSGSDLLVRVCCPPRLWNVPLPGGTAKVVLPGISRFVQYSPDGLSIIYLSSARTFSLMSLADRDTKRLFEVPENVERFRVSPDGKRIRYLVSPGLEGAPNDLWEVSIDGSNPHPVFPEMRGETFDGDWTADGKLFFFYRGTLLRNQLWVVREGSSKLKRAKPSLLYAGPLEIASPTSSKDSKEIYVIGTNAKGELSVFDDNTGRFVPFLDGISASFVAFSRDGKWITYVSYPEGELWKSRADGSEKQKLVGNPMGALLPRWSPDGKYIAFMEWYSSSQHQIYLVPSDGGEPLLIAGGEFQPADPTWAPDSKSIAYAGIWFGKDAHIEILDLATMKTRVLAGSEGLWSPRWSPDGKYIVAHTNESSPKLKLYSFETNSWLALAGRPAVGLEAWSHDSKYVYAYSTSDAIIFRVNVATGRTEDILSLKDVRWTAFRFRYNGWFDLTPDDKIMILRNTGSEDIYALQLDY